MNWETHEGESATGPDLLRHLEEALQELSGASGRSSAPRVPPPARPTLRRFYETTCVDFPGTGAAMQIISVPMPPELLAAWQFESPHGEEIPLAFQLAGPSAVERWFGLDNLNPIAPDLLVPAILYTRPDHASTYVAPDPDTRHTGQNLGWRHPCSANFRSRARRTLKREFSSLMIGR